MQIRSTAFSDGAPIPHRHTCDGEDLSPPLQWSDPPAGTLSFVLLCDDPDAPGGTWHHWAAYDIPAGTRSFDQGAAAHAAQSGFKQAINDFRKPGYGGPCPPHGHGPHRYRFRLLALSVAHLTAERTASCRDVEREARKHALAEAVLTGTYQR